MKEYTQAPVFMRAVGLLLLLFLPWRCFAQQPTAQSPRLAYSETQTLGGVTQAELVARVQEWAQRHSRDAQAAPVVAPDQALTVQGSEDVVYPQQGVVVSRPLHYALTLTVHETSYRYRLTELDLGPAGQPQAPEAAYQPVEPLLAPAPGQESTQAYLLRTAIEEAIGQLLGGLQYDLAHAVPVANEDN